ncbi:hypothetical protein LOTGIDRAFT_232728 [Lottia gigantea]|uniref:Uncharacterized protein n=1 Tax=Lottia gigantea TaxID=225164 RepID=V3ZPF1_LOTGI|nr:hypothetical protein LOTGIDRAFT_232728 [Lottia gigantea]ESO93288.1 hypothetical protein LOTGIDRAFT_232728 [Lottia gigantea]
MERQNCEDCISTEPMPAPNRRRPQYRNYVDCQRPCLSMKCSKQGGCRLWRQMMLGFITTAFIGLILLFLGSIFIADAVHEKNSVAIMLCVMGIVCGGIIIMATIILGKMCKLCISRKSRNDDEAPFPHQQGACFHTCSVVYTRSTDQIPNAGISDPPPSYDTVVTSNTLHDDNIHQYQQSTEHQAVVMVLPPKYDDIIGPLPPYKETE